MDLKPHDLKTMSMWEFAQFKKGYFDKHAPPDPDAPCPVTYERYIANLKASGLWYDRYDDVSVESIYK